MKSGPKSQKHLVPFSVPARVNPCNIQNKIQFVYFQYKKKMEDKLKMTKDFIYTNTLYSKKKKPANRNLEHTFLMFASGPN